MAKKRSPRIFRSRPKTLFTRATSVEHNIVVRAARRKKVTLQEYCIEAILKQARLDERERNAKKKLSTSNDAGKPEQQKVCPNCSCSNGHHD